MRQGLLQIRRTARLGHISVGLSRTGMA